MKKKLCLMLAVMLLLLSACGGQKTPETTAPEETVLQTEDSVSVEALAAPEDPVPVNAPEAEGVPIDFRMIYRGFTAVSLDDTENYERFCGYGTKMIASEEEWSSFMAAYCPGIPYSGDVGQPRGKTRLQSGGCHHFGEMERKLCRHGILQRPREFRLRAESHVG